MTQQVQLSLFEAPTLNIIKRQKELMNSTVKGCGSSRETIVDEMNSLAERYGVALVKGNGNRLTIDTFEKWINPSDTSRLMPMKALPVFCAVTGDYSALDIMARPIGCRVIGPEEQKLLEWAKAYQQAKKARTIMRQLEPEI